MSFQPTQIPGCLIWLDAADPSTLDANPVLTWRDKSGNGNDAIATSPPIGTGGPTQSTYNNYPVLSFNGTTQTLRSASCTITFNNHTLIAVHRPATITANLQGNTSLFRFQNIGGLQYVVFPYMNNTTPRGYITNATGATNIGAGNSTLVENSVTTSLNLIIANIAPTVQTVFKNGSQQSTNSQSISGTITYPLQIGCFPNITGSPSEFYQGDLAEMIIYNQALTIAQRQQIEGYLAWKWGLQASLPITQPYRFFPPTSLSIQTPTELNLVRTNIQRGTLTLPTAASIPGRILTFKDISGSFFNSSFTLSTAGADRFENGGNTRTLTERFGYITVASDGVDMWYPIDGTSLASYTIESLRNNIQISTINISTSGMTVSSFGFEDQFNNNVSSLITRSTLLFFGSNILGGSKVGPQLFLRASIPFNPRSISVLRMWYDAADTTTISFSDANNVSEWLDKSGNGNTARTRTGTIQMNQSFLNNYSMMTFSGSSFFSFTVSYTGTRKAIFAVVRVGPKVGVNQLNYQIIGGATSGVSPLVYSFNGALELNRQGANILVVASPVGFLSATSIVSATNSSTAVGAGRGIFINGTSQTLTTNLANLYTTGSGNVVLGGGDQTINIGEVLVYELDITQAQRQQVEGYLAWKWGLVGSLPATHPFKNSPP